MIFHRFRSCGYFFRRLSTALLVSPKKYNNAILPYTISTLFLWPFSWSHKPTLEEETANLMKIASLQIHDQKYDEADVTLHLILKRLAEASDDYKPTDLAGRRARVFRELAALRLLQGDYNGAAELLAGAIRSAIAEGMDPGDACIIELSLKLALLYHKQGDKDKAVTGLKFCFHNQLETATKALDSDSVPTGREVNDIALLGLICNAYGHFLIHEGDLEGARDKLQIALRCASRIYPSNHENCLHLNADLANIESRIGNVDEALERLRTVIDEAENQQTSSPMPLIRLFCTGAVIEGNRGEFDRSEEWLDKADSACNKLVNQKERSTAKKEIQSVRKMINSWQEEGTMDTVEGVI